VITYVEPSVLVKMVITEAGTEQAKAIWEGSPTVASVLLTQVEGRAALAAAHRGGRLSAFTYRRARQELDRYVDELSFVGVGEMLVERASELAEEHGLRGYDAVHVAAAELVGADVVTSADATVCEAARQLGFHVANPLDV
jgi:predicted nucleic acid-binding protein